VNCLYYGTSCSAGVQTEVEVKQALVGEAMERARAELEGRTGETDSEMEDGEPADDEAGFEDESNET
jgi:hypothetical protein